MIIARVVLNYEKWLIGPISHLFCMQFELLCYSRVDPRLA